MSRRHERSHALHALRSATYAIARREQPPPPAAECRHDYAMMTERARE